MGKSSHSTKRKRSKHSALGRTKKRSKTRRARSKKLRRPHDSDSYSTDDLRSLKSVSLSSEDSYRSRKSRSRIRKDVQGAKRKACSDSSSSEESHCFRKHKQLSRKNDSEVKSKTRRHKKKKAQRDASINSRSCSTCQSTGESSNESEYERHRGTSERRGNSIRKAMNVKSRSQKRRYRSRSSSSCSRHIGTDYRSQEKVTDGSKRLRSVIILTKNDEEGRELDCSQHKEEIIYESDGYPSDRSNDSNDGESKREFSDQSYEASEKQRPIEDDKREDGSVFNIKTAKVKDTCKDGGDRYLESQPSFGMFGTDNAIEEKSDEIPKATRNVNAEDLEVILRQKALENLRKFRGGMRINASAPNNEQDESNDALKSLSPRKADLSQSEYDKDGGAQGVGRDFVHSVEEDKILERRNGGNVYVSVKNNASLPSKVDAAGKGTVITTFGHGINKQKLVKSALKQSLSNASIPAMRSPSSQVANKVKLVSVSSVGDHNATSFSGSGNRAEVSNATHSASAKLSSCLASEGRDIGLNKLQDEDKEDTELEQTMVTSLEPVSSGVNDNTVINECGSDSAERSSYITSAIKGPEPDDGKEGSQLQKKTMSVMRGGEMVQVSYKVYIPKKAPALGRRQLKR